MGGCSRRPQQPGQRRRPLQVSAAKKGGGGGGKGGGAKKGPGSLMNAKPVEPYLQVCLWGGMPGGAAMAGPSDRLPHACPLPRHPPSACTHRLLALARAHARPSLISLLWW